MTGRNAPRLAPASTAITSHSVPVVLATYCSHCHIAAGFDRWQAAFAEGLRAMHANGQLVPEADPALALATLAARARSRTRRRWPSCSAVAGEN